MYLPNTVLEKLTYGLYQIVFCLATIASEHLTILDATVELHDRFSQMADMAFNRIDVLRVLPMKATVLK